MVRVIRAGDMRRNFPFRTERVLGTEGAGPFVGGHGERDTLGCEASELSANPEMEERGQEGDVQSTPEDAALALFATRLCMNACTCLCVGYSTNHEHNVSLAPANGTHPVVLETCLVAEERSRDAQPTRDTTDSRA